MNEASKRWKIWMGLTALFLSGAVVGGAATGFYVKARIARVIRGGPVMAREIMIRRMSRALDLSPDQQKQAERIVASAQAELQALREGARPQAQIVIKRATDDLKSLLSKPQRKKLIDLTARANNRWRAGPPGRPLLFGE
jgi:hypothetical protein